MLLYLLLLQIVLFSLVFYRLMTTNHWTLGKKLLVGLVGSLLFQVTGFVCIAAFSLSVILIAWMTLPLTIMASVMVYFIWIDEIHH